ncbi:hypothetical protein WJX81_006927 [Elliptochloris bilobata]|uniref:ARID domain-containing protein n=1 Tax=Elliptochloris bilobata TaxID=381761 RepID=A0AAW1QL79_9CHLO
MVSRPTHWRVLAAFSGPCLDPNAGLKDLGSVAELADLVGLGADVRVLRGKTPVEVAAQLASWQPNLLYLCAGTGPGPADMDAGAGMGAGLEDALAALEPALEGLDVDAVYVDALLGSDHARRLRGAGAAHVVHWDAAAPPGPGGALAAARFGHAFFALLRNASATVPEAFSVAAHAARAGDAGAQALPVFASDARPAAPGLDSVPLPRVPGLDLANGAAVGVPGWEAVRLLAPRAELRLLATGRATLNDAQRLGHLGEALRALLVLEVRQARLAGRNACERTPAHLPPGCNATRCALRSASGAAASVVLGGPLSVLAEEALVQHALRQTLVADALALQMRLPPPGAPAPAARASAAVAAGAPVVDALALTSVWAVHLLRTLCQDSGYRGLVALGIGAVGGTAVAAFTTADASRLASQPGDVAAAQAEPAQPQPAEGACAPAASGGGGGGGGGADAAAEGASPGDASDTDNDAPPMRKAGMPRKRASLGEAGGAAVRARTGGRGRGQGARGGAAASAWRSGRPRLAECSEGEFLSDLCAFLQTRCGRQVDADTFPDAVLNGSRLDLFGLYREVVTRGGFTVGNGINWKGQVFPRMRNYTATNRMTGVGNALKRLYQRYLVEYEQAHPEDVTGDACSLCGGTDEVAGDWISCDACSAWVHFSCDQRPGLGTFKDYARAGGEPYVCVRCAQAPRAAAAGDPDGDPEGSEGGGADDEEEED